MGVGQRLNCMALQTRNYATTSTEYSNEDLDFPFGKKPRTRKANLDVHGKQFDLIR